MTKLPHGGDTFSYKEKYKKNPLDFSANINPLGLPLSARLSLFFHKRDAEAYPDPLCRDLKEKIGLFEGVSPSFICCGNGASDLIFRIVSAAKPKRAMVVIPAFLEYSRALLEAGCEIVTYPLKEENGFLLTEEIIPAISDLDMLFLCNPNNPTGGIISKNLLIKIAKKCKQAGCILVLDECFIDFLDNTPAFTMKDRLKDYPNLIILKAFTKTFAMAGFRLGYLLCANETVIKKIESTGQPWPVSSVSAICGAVCLKDKKYLIKTKRLIKNQREYIIDALTKLGFFVYPAFANYLFFYSEESSLADDLAKEGILIRDCRNYEGLKAGFFRVAVKDRAKNKALIQAIKQIKERKYG